MKIHPRKLLAAWLMWSLVLMIVTVIATQSLAQPDEIIHVEYIVVTESEYKEQYEPIERPYRVETLTVTAYAPLDNKSGICADSDPTSTSTGTYPQMGTVAVNPDRFPYGTEFYIPGYGEGTALDTGGAVRQDSSKIDVFMETYEQAMEWGVQELEVIIYED
jgi:3D (Asp-Asp-Asp) domain-containing protein